MNVREWLNERGDGYGNLPPDEVQAIEDFTIVWTVFENAACDNNASVNEFKSIARDFADDDLHQAPLLEAYDYFSRRYFPEGEESHHFEYLNFRRRGGDVQAKELVANVLS